MTAANQRASDANVEEVAATLERDLAAQRVDVVRRAWEGLIAGLAANPDLGVQDLSARFVVRGTSALAAGEIGVGLVQGPDGTEYFLFGRSELDARVSEWSKLAEAAKAQSEALVTQLADVVQDLAVKEAVLLLAETESDLGYLDWLDARDAQDKAKEVVRLAERTFEQACAGQTEQIQLPSGAVAIGPVTEAGVFDRLKGVLKKLPRVHKKGLKSVVLKETAGRPMSYTDPNTGKTFKGNAAGDYTAARDRVRIFEGGNHPLVFKHEIGHHVHLRRLDDAARKRWSDFWGQGDHKLKPPKGKMPTGYAGTSAVEGFAEVYEYLYDHPDRLHADTKKLIEELLGGLK